MADLFKISGGTVHDPANQIDGQVRDIWIQEGKVTSAPTDPSVKPTRTLDATGMVVMPGGVDMHSHFAGPKVNAARKMRPEDKRNAEKVHRTSITHSGTMGSVPSTFATGYKYAGLGYTTAFDAAVPPLSARHAHEELADTPCIDKGFFTLLGNNHYVLKSIAENEPQKLEAFVGWLTGAAKAYAIKLVNPGGVEVWKHRPSGNIHSVDEPIDHFGVTSRQIVRELAKAVDGLHMPHPVHVHANNLGLPGNWETTLRTMEALEGHRGHITHIQFHSYGGGDGDEDTFCSRVAPLVEYVNEHENITVDVGHVVFGETTSMTGDGPLGYFLHNVYGTKWFSSDTELEAGCGIALIKYRNTSMVHAWQWAIGLEWYLMMKDPWRIAMSTDHPNGGSFLAYPQVIRLLMDSTFRKDVLKTVHPKVGEGSILADLGREYTLNEIAIITRASPAKMLGLTNKGHLSPGADADITIYTPNENQETMFEMPRMVIKTGKIIVEEGDIREAPMGKTMHVEPGYDVTVEKEIGEWFEQFYSIQFRNYPVSSDYLHEHEVVGTREST